MKKKTDKTEKASRTGPEIDKHSGVETTGHEWDGLKELNNPAPRWWLWIFLLTVIWSIWYWVMYPSWPTLSGHTEGLYGWTQHKQLKEQQAEILQRQQAYLEAFRAMPLDGIAEHEELYRFALAGGASAFKDNCAACHGIDAAGMSHYPNLNDDAWIWGGSLEDIYESIKYGIRSEHNETRYSEMPAFGADGILNRQEILDVTDYVLSLSGLAAENLRGAEIYREQCASCHGMDGRGDRSVGAPDLADAIWLYGSSRDAVYSVIYHSRNGVMPHWDGILSEDRIRQLTLYVHSLGGGE
ncbi:MAG: cytochrome-c oxidase, cbb3-type subunit III [Micavibrio sp.]|nr:MAG: cytochrome-c oxidase, cbb3-type subunit III [Micavibrio sp.]